MLMIGNPRHTKTRSVAIEINTSFTGVYYGRVLTCKVYVGVCGDVTVHVEGRERPISVDVNQHYFVFQQTQLRFVAIPRNFCKTQMR